MILKIKHVHNGLPQQVQLKVWPWPSQSPNRTINENLWIDLKRSVHARQPKELTELQSFCKEEWAKIPLTRTERHLAGNKKHLPAVILSKGGVAKYLVLIYMQGIQALAPVPFSHFNFKTV